MSKHTPLDRAEAALASGDGLAGTGFWGEVRRAKLAPGEADIDRIAEIDRRAFEQWALLTVPIRTGTTLAAVATIVGLVLIGIAYRLDRPANWIAFLFGFGVVWVTTHGLGHLIVGRWSGMRFTHWFIGTIGRPQPGVKVDYRTYLTSPAKARARMHAAGAVVSKAVPFVLLPAAYYSDLPSWVPPALAGFGIISIVTDILWSTTKSDWKKYRRERALGRTDSG